MPKLSFHQHMCYKALEQNKAIRVTFWGGVPHSMSIRVNIRTLNSLVARGLATKTHVKDTTYEYRLANVK